MPGRRQQNRDMEASIHLLSFALGGAEIIMILVVLLLLAFPLILTLLILFLVKVLSKPKHPPVLPESHRNPPTDEGR